MSETPDFFRSVGGTLVAQDYLGNPEPRTQNPVKGQKPAVNGEARESTPSSTNDVKLGSQTEGESRNSRGGQFISYPQVAGCKRSGTSREAAESTPAKTLRDSVLSVLRKAALTPDEAAERLGKSILSVRPRFSELVALNKIRETADRRRNASGKLASVYQVA